MIPKLVIRMTQNLLRAVAEVVQMVAAMLIAPVIVIQGEAEVDTIAVVVHQWVGMNTVVDDKVSRVVVVRKVVGEVEMVGVGQETREVDLREGVDALSVVEGMTPKGSL